MKEAWIRTSAAYSAQSDSGKIRVLLPKSLTPNGQVDFCATVPGFTGDADTHDRLIVPALSRGIGVICPTPRWSDSTRQMINDFESLFELLKTSPLDLQRLRFIRANSFGSYLALRWMEILGNQLTKVAFVAPCSARKLPAAGKLLQHVVRDDSEPFQPTRNDSLSVRIIALKEDSVVPETDSVFFLVSKRTERLTADSSDHTTAGNLELASGDVVKWFAAGEA